MLKRFEDEAGFKYNFYVILRRGEQVDVKCRQCDGHAYILSNNGQLEWRCTQCYARQVEQPLYQHYAKKVCTSCERWFNVRIKDEKRTMHKSAHVPCPHCGLIQLCELHRKPEQQGCYHDIQNGRDPIFHLELYFLDYVRGKVVWAMNRAHLNYLISYVSADLRVRRCAVPLRTASHTIPAYMKQAKNRADVVRTLKKLQYKQEQRQQ